MRLWIVQIQTQLSAVDNNNDIGRYPSSAKAVKDDKKYLFAYRIQLHLNTISKNANGASAFVGNFLCSVERVKRLVKVHLCCIVRNLKKDKRNVAVALLEKFLRTPMGQ